jgi:hypothetical protein
VPRSYSPGDDNILGAGGLPRRQCRIRIMDTDTLYRALTEALDASLAPYVAALEARLAAVEDRLAAHVPRRPITESVRRRHRAVLAALGGRCPGCGLARVLDEAGCASAGEWDHYFSRERRAFEEVWLVCRPCHLRMADRAKFAAAFEAYQQRAEQIEAGQLGLFA